MEKWCLLKDTDSFEPAVNMAVEEVIAQEVGNGSLSPALRLWRNKQKCFVLGKLTHTRLNSNYPLRKLIQGEKIGLIKRFSGGDVIFQDGGCLNFSVTVPSNHKFSFDKIGKIFKTLSLGVIRALNNLSVCAKHGKIDTAFCPGPYDIVVRGRKLAGVSLAKRAKFTLVHGTLLVNIDLDKYIETMEKFYQGLGENKKLQKDNITSLSEEMGRKIVLDELINHIIRGYTEVFSVQFVKQSLSSLQIYQAEKLSSNYRVQFAN